MYICYLYSTYAQNIDLKTDFYIYSRTRFHIHSPALVQHVWFEVMLDRTWFGVEEPQLVHLF